MNYSGIFSDDVASFFRSPVREIFKRVDLNSIYSFAGGYPSAETFPMEEIRSTMSEVIDKYAGKAFQYGATQGVMELREAVAERYGVPESVIAITILAGGTSLPELAASSVALIKGHGAMALGNVIGSNIANILLILGTCSTIAPLTMSGVTMVDVWVVVAAIAVLLLATLLLRARRISRVLALLLLVGYGLYMWYLLKA